MDRPWTLLPIHDCCEPLLALPPGLRRWSPHPYAALGAPYPAGSDPFQLRWSVLQRLLRAQRLLQERDPELELIVFDAYRPLQVQQFMVEHSLSLPGATPEAVAEIWAPPNPDPAAPPPHSTGAAVDLTLATRQGGLLEMGGAIDALGPVSLPDHFADADPGTSEGLWHRRRGWLAAAMGRAGFVRHPGEWWHFSWGDQLWAWQTGQLEARYGRLGAPV
ncbi:MAG: M15 family metallopeptidase [Cyanobacteriota bacterium]|nr:M15 family metallopeptidase [Cyanobacteriota bacterium]